MNLGEIKRRVKRSIGDEESVVIDETDLKDWANDAQVDIARRTHCLESEYTISIVAQTDSYDLPTDLLLIDSVTIDGLPLEKTSRQELDTFAPGRDASSDTGGLSTPNRFFKWGSKLYLWPKPSTDGTNNLKIFYVFRPTTMVDSDDSPDIPIQMHESIVMYCKAKAKEQLEEEAVAQSYMQQYELSLSAAMEETQWPYDDSYPAVRILASDW